MHLSLTILALLSCLAVLVPRATGGVQWPHARPEAEGVDPAALEALFRDLASDKHKDIKGVVILRHDKLISEAYFNGDTLDTLHDIRSATKSITALLIGIAIERHFIRSVDDPLALYLPGLPKDGKQKITLLNILNMRSGLDADDDDPLTPGNEDRLDASTDWMKTIYSVPMKNQPGQKYVYCSINAFLAGAVIENVTKMPLDMFAKQNLFDPLGIRQYQWRHVPINRTTGQGNLQITTRDAARIGELVLHKGQLGGRKIIDEVWVEKSLADQVPIAVVDPYADFYGYMWYSKVEPVGDRSVLVHFASGNGGNKIYIVPSLSMVVAITSSAYGHGYGQKRSQDILIRVLAASRS